MAEIVVDPMVWQIPLAILAVAAMIAIVYYIYIGITVRMARNRHRDPLGWVLLSFFLSPILVWIFLLIVGNAKR